MRGVRTDICCANICIVLSFYLFQVTINAVAMEFLLLIASDIFHIFFVFSFQCEHHTTIGAVHLAEYAVIVVTFCVALWENALKIKHHNNFERCLLPCDVREFFCLNLCFSLIYDAVSYSSVRSVNAETTFSFN